MGKENLDDASVRFFRDKGKSDTGRKRPWGGMVGRRVLLGGESMIND